MRKLLAAATVPFAVLAITTATVMAKPDGPDKVPPGQAKRDAAGEKPTPPGQAKQDAPAEEKVFPPIQGKRDEAQADKPANRTPPTQAKRDAPAADKPTPPGQAKRDEAKVDPPGQTQRDEAPAAIALADEPPALGRAVELASAGTVRVKAPGGREWTEVGADGGTVPDGSVVDARDGMVTLTVAADEQGTLHTARFYGAIFAVDQPAKAGKPTELVLHGGDFSECERRGRGSARAAAKRRSPVVRRVWGNGKGRFRTRGQFAAATVRGTVWSVEDRCESTVVKVYEGVVGVRDLVTRKISEVKAGERLRVAGRR